MIFDRFVPSSPSRTLEEWNAFIADLRESGPVPPLVYDLLRDLERMTTIARHLCAYSTRAARCPLLRRRRPLFIRIFRRLFHDV